MDWLKSNCQMHMFGNKDEAKYVYALRMSGKITGDEPGYASQCVECGDCVEKCPQSLEIPDFLANVARELEGPDMEERVAMAKQALDVE